MTFPQLSAIRLRLEAEVTEALRLPDYAGSALRGVFGHALRRLACMTRQKTCAGCPLLNTCPYAVIFESQPSAASGLQGRLRDAPRPYVIEPPAWGQRHWPVGSTLTFHLVLIGQARQQVALILLAWQHALARGLGPGCGPDQRPGQAHLQRVWQTDLGEDGEHCVLDHALGINAPLRPPAPLPPAPEGLEALTLHFETPLRLQDNGRAIPAQQLTAPILLRALLRRSHLLARCHEPDTLSGFVPFEQLVDIHALQDEKQLYWRDWSRHSSRQQSHMALGGAMGEWRLRGAIATLWPLLYLGQWLHVGKEAVFGLGGYRLSYEPPPVAAVPPQPR